MKILRGGIFFLNIAMLTSIQFPPSEGIGNYIRNLSNKLREQGHNVFIVTRGSAKQSQKFVDGIRVFELPFLLTYPFHVDTHGIFVRNFFNKLDDFDVLHIHSPMPPPCKPSNVGKIVSTFHSTLQTSWKLEGVGPLSFFNRFFGISSRHIESGIIRSSDSITTVSKSVANDLHRFYELNLQENNILGNAVGDAFLNQPNSPMKEKDDYLLWVGRIDYGKGLFDLVSAMKKIIQVKPSFRLLLVGRGPLEGVLKREVNAMRLGKNVIFSGFIENEKLPMLYSKASAYVQASYTEGLPTTVLEAMSRCAPIVATKVSGNVDLITNEVTGLLVPPKDPETLANKILYLIDNPDYGCTLGENARKTVLEKYTWDIVSKRFQDVYQN